MKYSDVIIGDVLHEFLASKGLLKRFKQNIVKHRFTHDKIFLKRIADSSIDAIDSFDWGRDANIDWCKLSMKFNDLIDSNNE